jgi:hypothetical protein
MAPADKGKHKLLPELLQGASPQGPQNLFRRLSSSLSSIVPNLPLRRVSGSNLFDRPTTEQGPPRILSKSHLRDHLRSSANQRRPIPQINIPLLSNADHSCPYDPNRYHSSPSIEPRRCDFCGIRSSSRPLRDLEAANNPCINCQTRGPFSHIASTFRRSRRQNRSNSAVQNDTARLREVSSSSDEAPRLVPAVIAAKRTGNPPRRAPLPPGMVTNYGTLRPPPNIHALPAERSAVQHGVISRPPNVAKSGVKDERGSDVRPISPKLHHIHGLPGAKKYPYVHKREVEAHLAALRAGSPSSLRCSIDEAPPSVVPPGSSYDYSETVFYGTSFSSNTNRRSSSTQLATSSNQRPRITITQRVEASRSIIIEGGERGGRPTNLHEELANSEVYHKRTPQPPNQHRQSRHANAPIPDTDSNDSYSFSTVTTQTPSTVGGKRLELRGGNPIPKLRGGNGGQQAVHAGRGYKFKKWFLTCQGPCRIGHNYNTESDDELPPARIPTPERVARAIQRAQGRAPLPANISRGCRRTVGSEHFSHQSANSSPVTSIVDKVPSAMGETTKHRHIPITPNSCGPTQAYPSRLSSSFFDALHPRSYRYTESPTNRPEPQSPPVPNLRGGAGSTSPWKNTDRLPPTLYWLAGGRGKPLKVGSWKKQKPKKRMGGLLGMTLYGHKAGKECELAPEAGGSGSVTTVEEGVEVAARATPISNKSSPKSVKSDSLSPSSAGAARAVPTPVDEQVSPPAAEKAPAAVDGAIPQSSVAAPNVSREVPVDE